MSSEPFNPTVSPEDFFGKTSDDYYRSVARRKAAQYRIDPDIFERQLNQESGFNPNARSPKGARGIGQFIPETGRRYGLINDEDFSDPHKSIDAAARHFRDLLDENDNDYESALAGYNAGQGRVRDRSWRKIPETRNYVKTILGNLSDEWKPTVSPDDFFAGRTAAPAEPAASPSVATPTRQERATNLQSDLAAGKHLPPTQPVAQGRNENRFKFKGGAALSPPPLAPDQTTALKEIRQKTPALQRPVTRQKDQTVSTVTGQEVAPTGTEPVGVRAAKGLTPQNLQRTLDETARWKGHIDFLKNWSKQASEKDRYARAEEIVRQTGTIRQDEKDALGIDPSWLRERFAEITGAAGEVTGNMLAEAGRLLPPVIGADSADLMTRLGENITKGSRVESGVYGGEGFVSDVTRGLGSSIPFFIAGTGGAAGKVGVGVMGALSNAGQVYDEAVKAGKTPDEAMLISFAAMPAGASEMWGIGGTLDRMGRRAAINQFIRSILREGGEEATQEAVQGVVNNLVAKGLYDPDRDVFQNVGYDSLVAGLTGGMFGVAGGFGGHLAERSDARVIRDTERAYEAGTEITPEMVRDYVGAQSREAERNAPEKPDLLERTIDRGIMAATRAFGEPKTTGAVSQEDLETEPEADLIARAERAVAEGREDELSVDELIAYDEARRRREQESPAPAASPAAEVARGAPVQTPESGAGEITQPTERRQRDRRITEGVAPEGIERRATPGRRSLDQILAEGPGRAITAQPSLEGAYNERQIAEREARRAAGETFPQPKASEPGTRRPPDFGTRGQPTGAQIPGKPDFATWTEADVRSQYPAEQQSRAISELRYEQLQRAGDPAASQLRGTLDDLYVAVSSGEMTEEQADRHRLEATQPATAGVTESAQLPSPQTVKRDIRPVKSGPITDRKSFRSAWQTIMPELDAQQLDAVETIGDAMAKAYAKMPGGSEAGWYEKFAGMERGGDVGDRAAAQTTQGATRFLEDGRAVIHAFENPNISTALHETFHVARRYLPDSLRQQLEAALDVEPGTTWSEEAEEHAADLWERYFYDGHAPTKELRTVFDAIKRWFRDIYRSLTNSRLDIQIPTEARQVFDAMLGAGQANNQAAVTPTPAPATSPEQKAVTAGVKKSRTTERPKGNDRYVVDGIDVRDFWNFKRSSFTSPEAEWQFINVIAAAVKQGNLEKQRRTVQQLKATAERVHPDLIRELEKFKPGDAIPHESVIFAAAEYAQTLATQAQGMMAEATRPGVTLDERIRLQNEADRLTEESVRISGSLIPVRSATGRALQMFGVQKGSEMTLDRVVQIITHKAKQRGVDVDGAEWRQQERKLTAMWQQVEAARKEAADLRAQIEAIQSGRVGAARKSAGRKSWRTKVSQTLTTRETIAEQRMRQRKPPDVLFQRGPRRTLSQAITRLGGIKPGMYRGEIEHAQEGLQRRGLISERGYELDDMIARLEEEGFGPFESHSDLFAALEQEAAGTPQYAREALEEMADEEVEQYLRELQEPEQEAGGAGPLPVEPTRRSVHEPVAREDVGQTTAAPESIPFSEPEFLEDAAAILASRVNRAGKDAPLDKLFSDLVADYGPLVEQNADHVKARADAILRDARHQALMDAAASRDGETRQTARQQLAQDVRETRKKRDAALRLVETKEQQLERTWDADERKAAETAETAWRREMQDLDAQEKYLRDLALNRTVDTTDQQANAEIQRELARVKQEREMLKYQRADWIDEAKMRAHDARKADLDEARAVYEVMDKELREVRESAEEAQKAEIRKSERERKKQERRAQQWDYQIELDGRAIEQKTASDPRYQPTVDDLAELGAWKAVQTGENRERWHQEMSQFDAYKKNPTKVKNAAIDIVKLAKQERLKGQLKNRIAAREAEAQKAAGVPKDQRTTAADLDALTQEQLDDLLLREKRAIKQLQQRQREWAKEFAKLEKRGAFETAIDVIDLTRALQSSIDLPFGRQAIRFWNNPVLMARSIGRTISTWTANQMDRRIDEFEQHPGFALAREFGVDLTTVASRYQPLQLSAQEEKAMNRLADKFLHVRVSNRQFSVAMDSLRLDYFWKQAERFIKQGYTPEANPEVFESLAWLVNTMSGRGDLGKANKYAPVLNRLMYSTRYAKSWIDWLTLPLHRRFWNAPAPVRRLMLFKWSMYLTQQAAILGIASLMGLKVGLDPEDDEFLKVQIGNHRIDFTGGAAAYARYAFRLGQWAMKQVTGERTFEGEEPWSLTSRFLRGKLSPGASLVVDASTKKTFTGKPFSWFGERWDDTELGAVQSRVAPMMTGELRESYKLGGYRSALATLGLTLPGINVSVYEEKKRPQTKSKAERFVKGARGEDIPDKPQAIAEYKRAQLKKDLLLALTNGAPAERVADLKQKIAATGKPLSKDEEKELREHAKTSELEYYFADIPLEDAYDALKLATPDERRMLLPILKKKENAAKNRGEYNRIQKQATAP